MSNDKLYNYIIKPPPPVAPVGEVVPVAQRITVIDKTKIKGSDRIKVIQKLFRDHALGDITITQWNDDNHEATILLGGQSFEVTTVDVEGQGPQVILAFKEQGPQSRGAAFTESCGKLFSNYKEDKIGTLEFLAKLLILPIWALYHMVTSFQGKEAQLENLLGNFSAHSPENFLKILESGVEFIKQTSPSANQDAVLLPMGAGIALGKNLLSAVKNPRLRNTFLEGAGGLNTKIGNLQDGQSVLIPTGYYTKGQYHPVLLYVVKRGGQLVVQKYSLATPDSSHTGRIPAFEEFELETDNIAAFTQSLITLLEEPKGTASSVERLKAAGLDTQRYTPDIKVNADPIGGVLTALGKRLAPVGKAVTPSEDPWKLIFSYATTVDPALLPEKTVFMTHVLENMVSETLKYAERLPLDKKEAYYKVLDVRIKKLEKHLLKHNPELADKIIGPLKAQIHRVVAESQAKMLRQGETSTIMALLEPGKSAPVHLSIPTKIAQTRTEQDQAALLEKSGSVGIVANRADLQKLESVFAPQAATPTQAQAGEALAALGALYAKIDQLIEAKDYIKARSAATLALATLPSIDNPAIFSNFTADQMDEMSQRIEQITGQLFESKLRLSDDHPSPEELVHLLNGRALMVSMVRTRIQKVHAEAQRLFLQGGRTAELRALYDIPLAPEEFGDFFFPNGNVLQIRKLERENDEQYQLVEELLPQLPKRIPGEDIVLTEVDYDLNDANGRILNITREINRLKGTPRNHAQEAAKFKQIAEFLHELGIPLIDAQLLCFDDFTLDSEKYRSLLQDNPYLSYGYDSNTAKKAGALAKFFVSDRGEFSERSAVLLNAFESSELFAPAKRLFSERLLQVHKIYEDQPRSDADFLREAKTEIKRSDTSLLPKFLIDLRRAEAWSDAVLNPKGSLYLGFATELGTKKWLLGNVQQAQQGTSLGSPNFFKKLRALQANDLRTRLVGMERVVLNIQLTALDEANPAVTFSQNNGGPATGFCLYPRGLPANFRDLGFPPDPLLFQDTLHYMPASLARAECSPMDEFLHFEADAAPPDPSILTKPGNTYAMMSHPPAYFYAAASENRLFPKLDPVDEAELLKLQSAKPEFGASYSFDFIIGRKHLLDNPDIQNRILQVLFHDRGLIKYLIRNPDQVLASTDLIQKRIGQCLESNQLVQAAFLSFILQKIKEALPEAAAFHKQIDEGNPAAIEGLRREEEAARLTQEKPFSSAYPAIVRPRSEAALHILKRLSQNLNRPNPTPEKLFEALSRPEIWTQPEGKTFSLFLLDNLNTASIPALTPDNIVIVLKAWELIRGNQTEVSLPTLRQHLQLKMEGSILPAVSDRLAGDQALRNAVLSTWKSSPSPEWQRDPENPCRFLATNALGVVQTYANEAGGQSECYLDLISCEATMRTAVGSQQASNLPDEVVNLPLYNKVFEGKQFVAKDVMGATPSQRVYTFTSKGKNFELVYDRSEQDANQKLSIYLTLAGVRYRYTTPIPSTQDNFANVIEHYGIWVREGERAPTAFSPQQSAILFPGRIDDYPTPQALWDAAFTIRMDNVGNVKEISKKEGPVTYQVFQDAKNTLASHFPFAHKNDIVFMKREGEDSISRIQFLNEKITLELNLDGSWSPLGNKDWKWRQTDTRPLVGQFGTSYQQFLLPFRKGGQEQYRIFPHPVAATRLKETGETVLEFAPSSPWESTATPVLTITKDASGVLHGTHAAFLYLAYVDLCQGNYERAVKHLNEAAKANAKESEIPVIETIAKMMQLQPHASGKQIAFQLKAALTIRTILRQSYQQFKIPASKEAMRQNEAENQRLRTLSDEYDQIPQGETVHLAASRLELTAQDKSELELFKAQALGAAKPRPAAPAPKALQLPVPRHARASQAFLPYLILSMEPPIPGATKETVLQLGASPTQENVLKHFWTYWTLISNNTITLRDLSGFYLPIPAPPGTDPALVEAVDFARRTLLSLAATKEAIGALQLRLIQLNGNLQENKATSNQVKDQLIQEINLIMQLQDMQPFEEQLTHDSSINDFEITLNYLPDEQLQTARTHILRLKELANQRRDLNINIEQVKQKFKDVDRFLGIRAAVPGAPNQEIFKLKKKLLEKQIIPTGGLPGKLVSFYDAMRQGTHNTAQAALEQACATPIDALLSGGKQNFPGAVALLPPTLTLAPPQLVPAPIEAKPPELPEIARQSFAALQTIIAQKEAVQLRPALQVATPIELTSRAGLLYADYMSVDTRLPTDTELTRLSDVLTERPQYNEEWLRTYTQIFYEEPNALAQLEPLDIKRSKDVGQQLLYAAASLKKAGQPLPPPAQFSAANKLAGYKALRNAFGEQQKTEQITKVEARSAVAQGTFADTGNPLTDFDNARTKSGIAADSAKKTEALKSSSFINERNVENFHRDLQVNIADLRRNLNAGAKDLVKAFTPHAKRFGLQETFRNTEQFSPLDQLNAILDLCENGAELPKEVLEKAADYLFLATELQQKEQALGELTALHDLGKQRREIASELQRNRKLPRTPLLEATAKNLEEALKTLEIEWKVVSTSITDKIKSGENHTRYSAEVYLPRLTAVLDKKIGEFGEDSTRLGREIAASTSQLDVVTRQLDAFPDKQALIAQQTSLFVKISAVQDEVRKGDALLEQKLQEEITTEDRKVAEQVVGTAVAAFIPDYVIKVRRDQELRRVAEEKRSEAAAAIQTLDSQVRELGLKLNTLEARDALVSKKEQLRLSIGKLTEKKTLLEARIQKLRARKEKVSPETGGLVDQGQTLPYLVREYRQKIVFTPGQVEKIEIILDDPHAVEVFRMGLGKSSVIFPCVARILVSRGELPIMIFTETLLEQSRAQMDKRAYIFNFSRGSRVAPQTLAEEYYSLLTAKHSGHYIMTTVDRVAALRNKIVEVHNIQSQQFEAAQKLKTQEGEVPPEKKAEYDKLYASMVETFEQLQWLKKIHAFFYAPDTRLVADEIDDIFSISSEKNFSDGKNPDPIDPTTFDAGEEIFKHVFASQNAEIQALRQAVIDDSLATWEPAKVQAAMKQVAIEILRDKDNANGYLRTHGWSQEQLDAIIPEDLGEYLSNLKAKVLPQGMAAWPKGPAEAGELKPFETMGALRHWMTKTVHTLSRKQAGKDYDYQKDLDACQNVVPLKDQVEKPNTKFGQESELVGYHLLAYSRKVPPQEFFAEQITALRRKAAEEGAGSPCAVLMEHIDLTGADSPQEIYTRINDNTPGRFLDRIAFLRFVMRDQTLIRIYRSQITCPVQDTAGVLSGASGSLNLFSLPPDVSSDPSNMAKNVTGETLSSQSLMGKGFEEDVTSFAELIPHMTGLTRDRKCKAIINQGYATENMPTKELIAHFRIENKVAGVQREYVFIDADKRAYFWLPGDTEQPRPFDKELNAKDIHADRVLYYFAPADTRGTDFKIPSGYGALIIGPTTTPDEYDQAIWRLRALGKGQEVKVYIQDRHAAAIRETQELQGNLQLGHVVRDVQLQGIKANTLQNFKAATSRPESTLRMRVADALMKPIEVGEVAALAQDRPKMEAVLRLNAQTFNAVKELYIRPKAMLYQSDYMPTDEEDITPFLESKHTETLERIDSTIARKLPGEPSENAAFNAWAARVRESLPIAKSEIEKHKQGLAAEDAKTKQNLEARVDKSKSVNEDQTSEITQEQQQQQQTETAQQQEQQATTERKGFKGDAYDSYVSPLFNPPSPYFDGGVASGYVNLFHTQDIQNPKYPANAVFNNCGIPPALMFTQSFSAIMDQGRSPGKMLGQLFLYKTDKGKIGAYLITGMDAEKIIPTVERARGMRNELVLRMISLPEDPTQPPKDYCAPTGDIGNIDEANQLIAISKLLMGYAVYPDHELAALRNWFTDLKPVEKNNLIATLHKRSAPEQTLKMLNDWLYL